jgi:hypothetical protein
MIVLWTFLAFGIQIYLVLGLLYAIFFALRDHARIDPEASGASWAFKLITMPGAIAFWPYLLFKRSQIMNRNQRKSHKLIWTLLFPLLAILSILAVINL